MDAKWYFPADNGGQYHGIGDSGIDLFKGNPIKSETREIIQNSIDACKDKSKPVIVEFSLFEMNTNDLPGIDELREVYQQASVFCKEQGFKKACNYFDKSIRAIFGERISILRISDFNTTGIKGASEADSNFTTPWFKLVRSVGSSDKEDGSIGAYGSGKMASFACSSLQTVFYSTLVDDEEPAFQGVSKLIGYKDVDGKLHTDLGYYCTGQSMPCMGKQLDLDHSFFRNETGTDVYIIGFKFGGEDWKRALVSSVLDGFFYALMENHLIVRVDGMEISSENVHDYVEEYHDEIDEKTVDYSYIIHSSEKTTSRMYSCLEENDVEIKMLVEKDLHKRVAMVRYPGMKVFDKGNISTTIPFAGICIIKGTRIAKLLGGLENIQHNQWELSRYDDEPELKNQARVERDRIYRFIRELFSELKGQDSDDEIDPGVGDCIQDPISNEEEKKPSLSDEVMEIGPAREQKVTPSSTMSTNNDERDPSPEGDENDGTGSGRPEHGPGPGPGPGPNPFPGPLPGPNSGPNPGPNPGPNHDGEHNSSNSSTSKLHLVKAKVRFIAQSVEAGEYIVYLTPYEDVNNGRVEIYLGAETDVYKASIISAKSGDISLECSGHKIEPITMQKDVKAPISVKLEYSDECTLEVRVYGY